MIQVVRETHDTPEAVAHRLQRAGGINRFGEANYRAVWGWNRLAWIGGRFEDRDEHGALLRERIELRKEPKYPAVNRWHIERWLPPETYGSPRAWYAQTIAEHIARAIEWSRNCARAKSRSRFYDREHRTERSYDQWAFDLMDDAVTAFHKQPFVTVV